MSGFGSYPSSLILLTTSLLWIYDIKPKSALVLLISSFMHVLVFVFEREKERKKTSEFG